jgi:hypothetical protein
MNPLVITLPDFWAGVIAVVLLEIVAVILIVGIDAWRNR